jgi:hypothetical protein
VVVVVYAGFLYGTNRWEYTLNEFDIVYDGEDADEILVIRMTRRQWLHLDDWRAEHPDRYPKRYAERQAALEAIDKAEPEMKG